MARKSKTEILTAPIPADEVVTVPRAALQALAEWAYPVFSFDRIWSKLPPQNPRRAYWNIDDDLHTELQRERMTFLKGIFWKAEQEAARRERSLDPTLGLGHKPSLEAFMACVAEMDDPHWDEPLTPKEVATRKKLIKAKKAKQAGLENALEHPSPESTIRFITMAGDISIAAIKKSLASEDPEIQAKAQEEIPRLVAELGKLATAS
ncbi:hypothetical protein [Geothrix oryzisoli]|uniref:hypothetical protein n=1 Tax=Geothrix oryzisoli TaxID=2922721 RepID=UPI001FAE50A5|nr:hypothetical protein [Geothrix oryzisoli]